MKRVWLILLACLIAPLSFADQSKSVGEFTAHYNVFNSASLSADIARLYGITRGGNQAVVLISVRKQLGNNDAEAKANVQGSAQNLIGQKVELTFKEIKEAQAIYYIATFRFDDKDHMKFKLTATPENGSAIDIDLTQQMFAEK
jgi:hypothetical protein